MRRIVIRLLGPFEVRSDGAPLSGFAYAKVRALLAYLAVERGRPHPREQLAALLWPDQPERSARGSLSQALTTLRNALGDRDAEEPLLSADVHHVQLNPHAAVEVDTHQFSAPMQWVSAHGHRSWRTCAACAGRLCEALEFYRGDFLADLVIPDSAAFEEWAGLQREHLRQCAMSALERLADRAEWRGAYAEALTYARRLVALDPLLEVSRRTLMRLLALNGETAATLAQYRQLAALLEQELGGEPEEATTALCEQIRRGGAAALLSPPPPFAVPLPPSPLVGRGEALGALCAQLREGSGRALTLTGAGGIGKTRLAVEAAHALRHDFEDGVCMVELAALADAALVADAVARALSVKEQPRQPLRETLREHLRSRHLLLILDNFEQVVEAAPLVSELLATCPALSVLVTSRAPLMIRAERQLVLEPLAADEAVGLFLQRAQAAGAGLPDDEASATAYSAICDRLDRLPLAIELIAVRARALSPAELLRQLERPLQAAAASQRDVSARHRSLRAAIQWSYDLLGSDEQRVFRCLGVFAGGCTAEAAQAVLGPSLDALPELETLTQVSLLQRQTLADETRFLTLATIREFALERLVQHGEDELARHRHADQFARFAMAAHTELLRPEAPRWRARVAAEHDNLRAAFRWAMDRGQYETALRIATGICRYHAMAGSLREGLEQLEAALAYGDYAPLAVQCGAMRVAGILASNMNDYPRARRWLEAAVEVAWRLDDKAALQPILTNLGHALLEQGELEDARIHLEVSLSLAQRGHDPALAKFPLGYLSGLHRRLGDYAEAQALGEECLRINEARQDPEGTANALVTLGTIALARGDRPRARELADLAMALHRTLNHQLGMGLGFTLLGDVARAQGDLVEALAHYQRCLDLWRERENAVTSAAVLDSVAQTLALMGAPDRGATLLGAAAALRERAGVRLTAAEQRACDESGRACRAALGEAAYAAALAAGRALTLAQAVALGLAPAAPAAA